jgi:non-specific serine/threonine protein kinase
MRALIDWSYDLLDAGERELFATLSIFIGSFSLESALAVGESATVEDYEVLDRLTSLVDKSLVVTEAGEYDVRYRLLESMRQYGRERLTASGGLHAAAHRHAVAYTELAERLEDEYGRTVYRAWVASAERETENIRAALTWTFGPDGDPTLGARLAAPLRRLFNTSYPAEARRWVQTALARAGPDSPPGTIARLELADAHLASTLNAFNASLAAARRALAGFSAAGDQRGIANAQRWAGRSLIFLGQIAEGEALMRSALATYAELGFRQIGGLLRDLGLARSASGDVSGARELFARALEQFVADQNEGDVAITAGTLAEAEFGAGDPEAAIRHAEEALAASDQLNDIINVWIRSNLAAFLIALDRFDHARVRIAEALRTARQIQSELDITVLLQHLAATLALDAPSDDDARLERSRVAARLTGFIDKQMREMDFAREFTEQQEYERMRRRLETTLGPEACAALIAEGAGLGVERALEIAAAADDAKVLSPA